MRANSKSPRARTQNEMLSLDESVGFRLSRVARARRRAWCDELDALAVTPAQASALRALVECPELSLRALARTLGTDPMSVKRCVDDLEKRDLVRSATAPGDRRPRVLTATQSGRDLAREIDRRVRLHEASLHDVLGSANYETLMAILSRLEQHLELDGAPFGVTETRSERL